MMPATEQDRAQLRDVLVITERRVAVLEHQQAYYGGRADPSIEMELVDLRTKINDLRERLEPPRSIPQDIWYSMSADDQRRYLIKLVMELQADFVGCRAKLNSDVKLLCGALIAAQLLSIVLAWWLR